MGKNAYICPQFQACVYCLEQAVFEMVPILDKKV